MVLGKLPVPGHPTVWMLSGQGSTALALGTDGGCLDSFTFCFTLIFLFSQWKTARYRLKFYLKVPLNPKQPYNLLQIFRLSR